MGTLKRLTQKLGMDKAIAYTSAARLIQAVGGVVSIVLISTCLTGVEQGFYYTFTSILAIQVFFELGLAGIITQFVAHEKAHLAEHDNALQGEERYRSRLAYLLRFCLKWYSILAGGLFVLLLAAGVIFFTHFHESAEPVSWRGPWMLLVFGTTVNFLIAPISAFLEGLGKVREIAFVRLIQQVVQMSLLYAGLLGGLKLYASSYVAIVGAVIFLSYAYHKFYPLLRNLYRVRVTEKISYRTEIFPYQWRIALSWISGYFIFQLFNPVLFATEGAVVAGQMGMTLAGLNAVLTFALSWITTKIPTMSEMIARGDFVALDTLFGRTIRQSLAVSVFGVACFAVVVFALRHFHVVLDGQVMGERFLPMLPMALMSMTIVLNVGVSAWATYLRCHKQEPFMIQSVVIGAFCMISTLVLGKLHGMMGVVVGYAAITIVSFVWGYAIYANKKKLWHQ